MVNLFFFLKFKSQLRRTRPDIVRQIDESLIRSINDAGGKITGDRFVISAVFNEDTIGFWLDIFILIENLIKNIESSKEFFGYSLVVSSKFPNSPELLCRFLANHGGIFVDEKSTKKLMPYAHFEKPIDWLKKTKKRKYGCYNFNKITELKSFKFENKNELDIHNDIAKIIKHEKEKNVLILGKYNIQRCGLYKFYNNYNGDFPPLVICFESAGIGAIVDLWSLNIRYLGGESSDIPTEEIDSLWEFLFRERVRDEVSEYARRCAKRLLRLVFEYYAAAAAEKNKKPVLILENIHLAENNTMNLFLETLAEIKKASRQKILILGTADDNIAVDRLQKWEPVFDKIIKIDNINNNIAIPRLSSELWEIIYAISLFSYYFSSELFLRLFEEEEKNPVMITKAFSILNSLGIIDSIREPRLMNRQFEEYAVKILDPNQTHESAAGSGDETHSSVDKIERVKSIVRNRLISWAVKRNLNPCFRLLTIIAGLGGVKQINDMLLLKALTSDIANKTVTAIETAAANGQFEELLGAKSGVIRHIYRTSRALSIGNKDDIENAFSDTKDENFISDYASYPVLNAQITANFCCYYLCKYDEKEAVNKAKEAILLGQNKNSYCLPQSYRLFALVCLSKQRINETIEYLGFALASAEKIGNNHELAISAYYAAAAQFLYGDIFTASRLARKSIEQSLSAGHPDWADRSLFIEGRLEFELGHYSEALRIFENLLNNPYGSRTAEKENLLSAWIYRSKVYLKEKVIKKPDKANIDACLFEIEEAYLSEKYKKAIDMIKVFNYPLNEENFLFSEKADWRSGFDQCEHLFFTHGEIMSRMISVFYSLSLSRLFASDTLEKFDLSDTSDISKDGEDAVQGIQKVLRDDKLCEIDPWESFYFYSKYLILEQTGANMVDLSTAVSMAFKRLQRRAGRIEDIETRRQYLNGSKWNRELSLTAKEFKLI